MAPLRSALFAALAAAAAAADVKLVPVMEAGATSTGCSQGGCKYAAFRIPGLVNAGNNTMIAFAEGRKFGCGDFGPPPPPGKHGWGQHDMVISRSTDGGHTFGPLTTVLDALSFPPWKNIDAEAKPDNGNAIWDPTPVWDKHTDTVWFFFNGPGREAADCLNGICSTWATTSTDKGLTVRSRLPPPHPTPHDIDPAPSRSNARRGLGSVVGGDEYDDAVPASGQDPRHLRRQHPRQRPRHPALLRPARHPHVYAPIPLAFHPAG